MFFKKSSTSQAFVLPSIIVVSTIALIVISGVMQSMGAVERLNKTEYYNRLAGEAAEAGLEHAVACMKINTRQQTWSSASGGVGPLTHTSTCTGAPLTSPVSGVYSGTVGDRVVTQYSIDDVEVSTNDFARITARGTTRVLAQDTSSVIAEFVQVRTKHIQWTAPVNISKTVSGAKRTCFIKNSQAWCWGENTNGVTLGSGTSGDSLVPIPVARNAGGLLGRAVIDLAAGWEHTCALADNKKVYCWGMDDYNQLGGNPYSINNSNTPVRVTLGGGDYDAKSIATWGFGACAIIDEPGNNAVNNKVMCWGSERYEADGNEDATIYPNPRGAIPRFVSTNSWPESLPNNYQATKLSSGGAGTEHMCLIDNAGGLYCWGKNSRKEAGSPLPVDFIFSPERVNVGGRYVLDVSADGWVTYGSSWYTPSCNISCAHTCIVAADNSYGANPRVYCWGTNNYGQVGDGTTTRRNSIVPVTGAVAGVDVQSVSVGHRHSCALSTAGQVYCWGYHGSEGMVGTGTWQGTYTSSVLVQGDLAGRTVTNIGAGANRSCAFGIGFAYCWGRNNAGQIGDGTQINRRVPTRAIFLEPDPESYIF